MKINTSKPIILYGAGQLGRLFLQLTRYSNLDINCFIDEFSPHVEYEGYPILRLSQITDELLGFQVVVCAFKTSNPETIYSELYALGFSFVTDAYDFLYGFKGASFYNGWRFGSTRIESKIHRYYKKIYNSLGCSHSAKLFDLNLQYRLGCIGNAPFKEMLTSEAEKYSNDIVHNFFRTSLPELIVDCGAWEFELFKQLVNLGPPPSATDYVAIDPHPWSLTKYLEIKSTLEKAFVNVRFYPCALVGSGHNTNQSFFNGSMSMASRVVSRCSPFATAVSSELLSNLIPLDKPSFVKLHIESSEYPVLREFFGKLSMKVPHLIVINCSHTPEGLLEIPYFLACNNCLLYYRQHAFYGEGLTLYALTQ